MTTSRSETPPHPFPRESDEDQTFLDEAFDRALDRLERGLSVGVDDLLGGRERLRDDVEAVIRLAEQTAIGPHRVRPSLPGYTILEEIGSGGMGVVYLARQDRLGGRAVALKVLPASMALSARARDRFRMEADAIARLAHPNIVTIYDVVDVHGVYAYAMEFIDGRSLGQLIESRPAESPYSGIEPSLACRVASAAARALHAVHQSGMLHRDVKPSNILLRADGTPLLTDFGLARPADSSVLTHPGQFVGTPAYASPEQLRGGRLDHRSDVFSLGATLFHALTGVLPYAGRSPAEILQAIESMPTPRARRHNARLPADLDTIVAKAMDPDPERRYASAGAFADDIERLLNFQPIRARPTGLMRRSLKAARRNRKSLVGAVLGATAALVVVLVGLAWFVLAPRMSQQHITEARLLLLDPEHANSLLGAVLFGDEAVDRTTTSNDMLAIAKRHYDRAAMWGHLHAQGQREREAVRVAMAIRRNERDANSGREPTWLDDENVALPAIEEISAQVARPRGLLALLTGDMALAVAMWESLPLEAAPDPFIEAALGQVYLSVDRDAQALAALASAHRGFPDVGFICVNYADAAIRVGDLPLATRLVEKARGLDHHDQYDSLRRIEADLAALKAEAARQAGDQAAAAALDAEAEGHYEFFRRTRRNGPARDRYAQYLIHRGRLREAVEIYAETIRVYPTVTAYFAKFLDAGDRWWDSLDALQQCQEIRRALDGDYLLFECLHLRAGGLSPETARATRSPTSTMFNSAQIQRIRQARDAIPAQSGASYGQRLTLDDLERRLAPLDVVWWGNVGRLPTIAREAMIGIWMMPVPDHAVAVSRVLASAVWMRPRREVPITLATSNLVAPFAAVGDSPEVSDAAWTWPTEFGEVRHHGSDRISMTPDRDRVVFDVMPGEGRVSAAFVWPCTIEGDFTFETTLRWVSADSRYTFAARAVRPGGFSAESGFWQGRPNASANVSVRVLTAGTVRPTAEGRFRLVRHGRVLLSQYDIGKGWQTLNVMYGRELEGPASLRFQVIVDGTSLTGCQFEARDIRIEAAGVTPGPEAPSGSP